MKTMYVYILKCADESYYTGVTNNLENRFEQHKQGININCYTYSRRPLELVFYELFNSPKTAVEFEKKIKKWSKNKKEALIKKNFDLLPSLSKKDFGRHNANARFSIHHPLEADDTRSDPSHRLDATTALD